MEGNGEALFKDAMISFWHGKFPETDCCDGCKLCEYTKTHWLNCIPEMGELMYGMWIIAQLSYYIKKYQSNLPY